MEKSLGIFFILTSIICLASLTALLKKASQETTSFWVITISTFILCLCSLVCALAFQKSEIPQLWQHKKAIGVLSLAGFLNFVGVYFSIRAFDYFLVWQQTMFKVLVPVFAAVFAYFLLGEPLHYKFIIGLIIMSNGLFIGTASIGDH